MIELDMRRDLAKVSRETTATPAIDSCTYTAPCAIGAMMTPAQREQLRGSGYNSTRVGALIDGLYGTDKMISVPEDQIKDFENLQSAFDRNAFRFDELLAQLKEKYGA